MNDLAAMPFSATLKSKAKELKDGGLI